MRPSDFSDAWQAVEDDVVGMLRSKGLRAQLIEDLAQETALRAFHHVDRLATAEDLRRWACRVADNLSKDARRRARPVAPLESVADMPAPEDDPDVRVSARLKVEHLPEAFSRLSRLEREAVVAAVNEVEGSTNRDAQRRFRARAKLAAFLAKIGAAGLVVRVLTRRRPANAAAVLGAVLAGAIALAALGPAFTSDSNDDAVMDHPRDRAPAGVLEVNRSGGASAPPPPPDDVRAPVDGATVAGATTPTDGTVADAWIDPSVWRHWDMPTATGGHIGQRPGRNEPLVCVNAGSPQPVACVDRPPVTTPPPPPGVTPVTVPRLP